MAQSKGRAFLVKKGGTTIASVRQKSVTWQGQPIDTTNDDDGGDTSFLKDEFASTSLEISVEGMTDDEVLSDIAFATGHAAKHLSDLTLTKPNGDVIAGAFIMTNYSETGSYEGAVEFSATFVRNGSHTFTPAA